MDRDTSVRGRVVVLTGASRGLGVHIAHRLALDGARLVLAARSADGLASVCADVQRLGAEAYAAPTDVRDTRHLKALVEAALDRFGTIDVVVNNAGIDSYAPYHERTEEQIEEEVRVNLMAALHLTRLVLPAMLHQRRGHFVFVSSLAGKIGLPYSEVYAATKAGLILFASSLRAEYRGTGVSASAVVPGYVDDGMYTRLKRATGLTAPRLAGTSRPEAVAAAVLRAIARDLPEIIVSPAPFRPLLAAAALYPPLLDRLARLGRSGLFRRSAELRIDQAGSDEAACDPPRRVKT